MKSLFLILIVLCAAATANAQEVYQCVRPDGSVVCTVTDKTGDPSVTCNHECVDCNMTCAARLRLSGEGGEAVPVVPPPVPSERRQGEPGGVESRAYCNQRYQECMTKCNAGPANRTTEDREACFSSCKSWYSGCGTWTPGADRN